ncbi:MAG: S-adenosylmethionine:tRNA ribosyltransferase-isomerase [Egibacteraceae bacterium]
MTAVLTAAPPLEDPLDFKLPADLATTPAEARGLARDQVRLLVARNRGESLAHTTFRALPDVLAPGDLLVVNTSATLPAAVPAGDVLVHLSTPFPTTSSLRQIILGLVGKGVESTRPPGDLWLVELRWPDGAGSRPHYHGQAGAVALPDGASVSLLAPYAPGPEGVRLWLATLDLGGAELHAYLHRHGRPVRYTADHPWPLDVYQTVFATQPGSVEMPSAARGFTPQLVTRLVARDVAIAPLVLHTGVSSQEAGEAPYPERYQVPEATARAVNTTRAAGGRVVAVGTTVTRALETVAGTDGRVHPGAGWTELVVTPERGVRAVDGLVTGWHEPGASHLALLQAVAGRDPVARSYTAALDAGYRWHEFGDLHLLLP